jgi:hypothetical protein
MKSFIPLLKKNILFATEVLLVFALVQIVAYAFGHFNAITIALVLLVGASFLFITAFLIAQARDKKQKNRFALKM